MTSPKMQPKIDLAGYCYFQPHYLQTRARINYLMESYISLNILSDRLLDLPKQFEQPQQRPWETINWKEINSNQIVGIHPDVFSLVIASAVEIETPIRAYSQESRNYLQQVHPQLAHFMGGSYDENGNILEVGLWEKEERQHAPAFNKIYQQITGEKLKSIPNSVKGYQPQGNPRAEIYHHATSRIATEWSAVSIYLWLMAHSTGALQMAISQPLQDEVNHLAKFWGITRWGFGESALSFATDSSKQLLKLINHHQAERSTSNYLLRIPHPSYGIEIGFTFSRVMVQMWRWNNHLHLDALKDTFGNNF